jgi:type II secretory pathway predicted ATPase ExeA
VRLAIGRIDAALERGIEQSVVPAGGRSVESRVETAMGQSRPSQKRPQLRPTYVEYYALAEPPFGLAPNPRFMYQSRAHSAALEQLVQALNRRNGLMVISGEVGTGKTTTCRALMEQLPAATLRHRNHYPLAMSPDARRGTL